MFDGRRISEKEFPQNLNWNHTHLVLVTGDTPCGHMLLYVGGGLGNYFHFNGPSIFDYPHYMAGEGEYKRYLRENKKDEVYRKFIDISHPKEAEFELRCLMQNKWRTRLLFHNCASFAKMVIHAGGAFWEMRENCPVFGVYGKLRQEGLVQ